MCSFFTYGGTQMATKSSGGSPAVLIRITPWRGRRPFDYSTRSALWFSGLSSHPGGMRDGGLRTPGMICSKSQQKSRALTNSQPRIPGRPSPSY